jgi:hypothetical protein
MMCDKETTVFLIVDANEKKEKGLAWICVILVTVIAIVVYETWINLG